MYLSIYLCMLLQFEHFKIRYKFQAYWMQLIIKGGYLGFSNRVLRFYNLYLPQGGNGSATANSIFQ